MSIIYKEITYKKQGLYLTFSEKISATSFKSSNVNFLDKNTVHDSSSPCKDVGLIFLIVKQ